MPLMVLNLVFTAAASPEDWEKSRSKLRKEHVNHHLLDCSDAHSFAGTAEKDRIGNCFTWIKADTTFAGLRHALFEFDDRIYIGDEPPKLKQVRQNKTHYIKSVNFSEGARHNGRNMFQRESIKPRIGGSLRTNAAEKARRGYNWIARKF